MWGNPHWQGCIISSEWALHVAIDSAGLGQMLGWNEISSHVLSDRSHQGLLKVIDSLV